MDWTEHSRKVSSSRFYFRRLSAERPFSNLDVINKTGTATKTVTGESSSFFESPRMVFSLDQPTVDFLTWLSELRYFEDVRFFQTF